MSERKLLLETLKGEKQSRKPFWLMRQAGRYLPEYKEVRAKAGSFLNLCFNPEIATEVTLQPIRRFDMDAAILFSDILTVPYALGQNLTFNEGEGPRLGEYKGVENFNSISNDHFIDKLKPVYEAVSEIKKQLPDDKTLIGFAGAPWTVACYMVQGKGDKTFDKVKEYADINKSDFNLLLDVLIDKTILHLSKQIEAGAEVIQLFDSWAGLLSENELNAYSVKPIARIISALKIKHPNTPIIVFPKGIKDYAGFALMTKADGISIDSNANLEKVLKAIDNKAVVQGNLDPKILLRGGEELIKQTHAILHIAKDYRFIFNLGHGVLKETPPDNVALLAKTVRKYEG